MLKRGTVRHVWFFICNTDVRGTNAESECLGICLKVVHEYGYKLNWIGDSFPSFINAKKNQDFIWSKSIMNNVIVIKI